MVQKCTQQLLYQLGTPFDRKTHQEAHEIKGEHSRYPAERQALEHCAANSG